MNARKSSRVVTWQGCDAAPAQVFCQLVGLEHLNWATNGRMLVLACLLALHLVTSHYTMFLKQHPKSFDMRRLAAKKLHFHSHI